MNKRFYDLVDVIEAAYAVDSDEATWLGRVVEAATPLLDQGVGMYGVTVDITTDGRLANPIMSAPARGASEEAALMFPVAMKSVPPDLVRAYTRAPVSTGSQVLGSNAPEQYEFNARVMAVTGMKDGLGIVGRSPLGRAIILVAGLTRITKPTRAFSVRWSRVAAHLAAGLRLQQRHDRVLEEFVDNSITRSEPIDTADAILEPNGTLSHAVADAAAPKAREALRDAARSIDRARSSSLRREPDDAVAAWRALVGGRWSLVDHFDRDGRRFLVARPNQPGTQAHDALTPRQREVVSYAALGHANKLIAYELGLPESTISTELRHAAKRLGARTRLELVRMFAASAPRGRSC